MPYRDGTGPNGQGAATGRGFGLCVNARPKAGLGLGCGRGYRNRVFCQTRNVDNINNKQSLVAEKEKLEIRLEAIKRQLES